MRSWVLDALKGVAIILVVLFHGAFDLQYFAHMPLDLDSWGFWLIGRSAACLFIGISGICFVLAGRIYGSYSFVRRGKRSLYLLGIAGLITLGSWVFLGEGTIVFGILHFLAIAPLIAYPLVHSSLLLAGALLIVCATSYIFDTLV